MRDVYPCGGLWMSFDGRGLRRRHAADRLRGDRYGLRVDVLPEAAGLALHRDPHTVCVRGRRSTWFVEFALRATLPRPPRQQGAHPSLSVGLIGTPIAAYTSGEQRDPRLSRLPGWSAWHANSWPAIAGRGRDLAQPAWPTHAGHRAPTSSRRGGRRARPLRPPHRGARARPSRAALRRRAVALQPPGGYRAGARAVRSTTGRRPSASRGGG